MRSGVDAKVLVLGLALCGFASSVRAYNEDVHLDTIARVVSDSWDGLRGPDEKLLVAFCTELPDESVELSAVALYRGLAASPESYARWVRTGSTGSTPLGDERARVMASVQQLLHGLTGGPSGPITEGAVETAGELATATRGFEPGTSERASHLCALGFSLHLLSDSYAHRVLARSAGAQEPGDNYGTGLGHFRSGYTPDFLLRRHPENGIAHWAQLLENLGRVGSRLGKVGDTTSLAKRVHGIATRRESRWATFWGGIRRKEQEIRDVLGDAFSGWPEAVQPRNHSPESCSCYVERVWQAGVFDGVARPDCSRSWQVFEEQAAGRYAVDEGVCNPHRTVELRMLECKLGTDAEPFAAPELPACRLQTGAKAPTPPASAAPRSPARSSG